MRPSAAGDADIIQTWYIPNLHPHFESAVVLSSSWVTFAPYSHASLLVHWSVHALIIIKTVTQFDVGAKTGFDSQAERSSHAIVILFFIA